MYILSIFSWYVLVCNPVPLQQSVNILSAVVVLVLMFKRNPTTVQLAVQLIMSQQPSSTNELLDITFFI